MRHLLSKNLFFSALERTFTKELTFEGMLEEERIARIGSNDPESHLGIPCSHVSCSGQPSFPYSYYGEGRMQKRRGVHCMPTFCYFSFNLSLCFILYVGSVVSLPMVYY